MNQSTAVRTPGRHENSFKFSARSKKNLVGVHDHLVLVAYHALGYSPVDFGITEGVRSAARHAELRASGASQVAVSRHQSGHAIDVAAWIGGRISWELPLYCDIAVAFRRASIETKIPIRWGACWKLLTSIKGDDREAMMQAIEDYGAARRAQGRRPFVDGPHLELPANKYP